MTDCPCWGVHKWEIDDYFVRSGNCYWCDCHTWCFDCEDTRPAPGLIHQCTVDPK